MQRIESVETLKEMGKRVLKEGFDHKIYNYGDDNMFEIFKDTQKIFEFVCPKTVTKEFLNEAVNF